MEDKGVILYSHEHQCSLATTFRSLPDPYGPSNDTVLRTLNLKLEASCTVSASQTSSRLFVVESIAYDRAPSIAKEPSKAREPTFTNMGYFWRAMDYLKARRRLSRFRRYYSHLQDELETVRDAIEGETPLLDLRKPDVLMCSLYLLLWMIDMLAHRRFPGKAGRTFWDGLPAHSQLGGFFVLCHLYTYYLLGWKMLHSSRAAGLVSCYSLTEYVLQRV